MGQRCCILDAGTHSSGPTVKAVGSATGGQPEAFDSMPLEWVFWLTQQAAVGTKQTCCSSSNLSSPGSLVERVSHTPHVHEHQNYIVHIGVCNCRQFGLNIRCCSELNNRQSSQTMRGVCVCVCVCACVGVGVWGVGVWGCGGVCVCVCVPSGSAHAPQSAAGVRACGAAATALGGRRSGSASAPWPPHRPAAGAC